MKTLNQISEALKDRRLSVVSDATGIHQNTIRAIRDDPDANPTYSVIFALSSYLEGCDTHDDQI